MPSRTDNERRMKEEVNKILAGLSDISDDIDEIIKEVATTKETSSTYWNSILVRIRSAYEAARQESTEFILTHGADLYAERIKEEITRLKYKELVPAGSISYKEFISKNSVKQSLKSILSETVATMAAGFLSGEKTLTRLANLTQQINLSEKQVEKAIASGYETGGSATASQKALQKELMKKALDGKSITIVNRNGNTEKWKISTYAEMVTRVKLQEAAAQAVINTAVEVGSDLVQVSAHNTLCDVCAKYEGKIFSLSGKDKRFPPATELPPFHPNCMHSLTVVIEEALEAAGILDKYIEFSNGRSEEHPTRAGFIPVSERELE